MIKVQPVVEVDLFIIVRILMVEELRFLLVQEVANFFEFGFHSFPVNKLPRVLKVEHCEVSERIGFTISWNNTPQLISFIGHFDAILSLGSDQPFQKK